MALTNPNGFKFGNSPIAKFFHALCSNSLWVTFSVARVGSGAQNRANVYGNWSCALYVNEGLTPILRASLYKNYTTCFVHYYNKLFCVLYCAATLYYTLSLLCRYCVVMES